MGYYLGVDIGGTKSHALVADGEGAVLGLGEAGAGNHEVVGYDGLADALQQVTIQALGSAGISTPQLAGAGFGVAGYDWPSELAPTRAAIDRLGLGSPYEVANDTIIGLVAGASQGWGVAIVAGTGNNCRGRDLQGREGRITGNGGWFGEYGGAGELVGKALQAVAYEWSHRGPATALTPAFLSLTGASSIEQLLEGLVMERYWLSSSAAPLVFQVAAQGDPAAIEAVRWAGCELGESAKAVIRQLDMQHQVFEVVLVGSLFEGGALLLDALRQTIQELAPNARLVRLAAPPVVGGVLLGMQASGWLVPGPQLAAMRQKLLTSAEAFFQSRSLA
jgi:N-acetylglucosamine kinase-like BadF-type ATPase